MEDETFSAIFFKFSNASDGIEPYPEEKIQ